MYKPTNVTINKLYVWVQHNHSIKHGSKNNEYQLLTYWCF